MVQVQCSCGHPTADSRPHKYKIPTFRQFCNMASIVLPRSVSDGEKSVWVRVIAKRRGEVQKMEEADVEMLLEEPVMSSVGEMPSSVDGAISKFDWVLRKLICSTIDPTTAPTTRRDAYRDLKILLSRVENTKSKITEMPLSNMEIEASKPISQSGNDLTKSIHANTQKPLSQIEKGNQDVRNTNAPSDGALSGFVGTSGVIDGRRDAGTQGATTGTANNTLSYQQKSKLTQSTPSFPPSDSRPTSVLVSDSARNCSNEATSGARESYDNNGNSSAQELLTTCNPAISQATAAPAPAFPPQSYSNTTQHENARPRVVTSEYHLQETSRKANNGHREPCHNTTGATPHNRNTADAANRFAFLPPHSGIGRHQEQLQNHSLQNRQSGDDGRKSNWGTPSATTGGSYGSSSAPNKPPSNAVTKLHNAVSAPANVMSSIAAASMPCQQDSTSQPVTAPLPIQVTSASSDVPNPINMSGNSSAPVSSAGASRKALDSNFVPPAQNGSKQPLSSPHRKQSPAPLVIPQIPTVLQPTLPLEQKRWFAEAQPKFTGALGKRPLGEFSWKQSILTKPEVDDAIRRLYVWDPYWEMLDILALTKNSAIDSIAYMDKPHGKGKDQHQPPTQNRAVEVQIAVPLYYQKLIKDWNRLRGVIAAMTMAM
jgi:hypothetical protein